MKISLRRLIGALCFALVFTGKLLAQHGGGACCDTGFCGPCNDAACNDCCDTGCDSCCDSGCDSQTWGAFGQIELLLLRYHRADGVRIGADPGERTEFGFEPATRYTLGVVSPGGVGIRGRYFNYDHFEGAEDAAAGDGIGVDTYNVDLELFDTFVMSDQWAAEVSAGGRYNDFSEQMIDVGELDFRSVDFDGVGLLAGLELRRLAGLGHLYARARGAVLQGDKTILNVDGPVGPTVQGPVTLTDTTMTVMELALGFEANYQLSNGAVLFGRAGGEMQNWANYSNAFDTITNAITGEGVFDGVSDIGFGGIALSGGVSY